MSKYIIVGIIVIGIIIIWLMMGTKESEFPDKESEFPDPDPGIEGEIKENFMQLEGDANTGLPRFHYYHHHRGYNVRSPVMQPHYIEDELYSWYHENGKINGIQYQSALTQCKAWGFIT